MKNKINNPNITTASIYSKDGRLLAKCQNSYTKTHPIQAKFAARANRPHALYLHAEIHAIIKALKRGKPHSIKIERFYKDGSAALAKPCEICCQAIKESGIKEIFHT